MCFEMQTLTADKGVLQLKLFFGKHKPVLTMQSIQMGAAVAWLHGGFWKPSSAGGNQQAVQQRLL